MNYYVSMHDGVHIRTAPTPRRPFMVVTCLDPFDTDTGDDYLVPAGGCAPEAVARYCVHRVCLSVCMCVCVSGQYFSILFIGY